jgi:myo-inositol 2-dehydrogenase / D-chiro-inositol 1-dehydrogenase
MRIGLLGAGRIGQIHARSAAGHKSAKLAAVFDVDAKAANAIATETGASVAKGIPDIIGDKNIDAVLICTPTDTHADLIEQAAKAGKAIFCEKPVDLSVERVRACLKVVADTKAKLMIGFNRRFDPSFATLQKRLAAGEVGKPEIVTILSRDPGPPPISYITRSGGLFRDMMIHDLDMARFLLGEEPVEVSAMAACLVDPAIGQAGDIDTAVVTLKTRSGKLAQISNSRRATYGYDQRIEVHGSGGLLRADNQHATTVHKATGDGFSSDPVLNFFLERYTPAYRAEMDAFVTGVLEGKPLNPTGEDGLKALVLADAAEESVKSGRSVKVG